MTTDRFICGVDVGGTSIKFGLFTPQGELRRRWRIPTDTSYQGRNILPQIARSIRSQLPLSQLLGVGMGVPGPVQADGMVNRCVNLGWSMVPAGQTLSALLDGVPVQVANDANAAALGECWQGAGQGASSLLLVTLGTGVGSGIVLEGRLLAGAHGSAGELGHLTVNFQEKQVCACGKRGCLEQYASASGILRMARETGLSARDAKEVCTLAAAGVKPACEVVEKAGRLLGVALSHAVCLLDVERILLGGGVAAAGAVLMNPTQESFRANVFPASAETELGFAALGNDAGLYGAARLALSGQSATTSL